MFCIKCGKELPGSAVYCPFCGEKAFNINQQPDVQDSTTETAVCISNSQAIVPASDCISKKSRLAALLLGIFLGRFGIHNFYLGRFGRAITQLILSVSAWVIYFGAIIGAVLEANRQKTAYIPNPAKVNEAVTSFGLILPPFILILVGVGIWALVEWILIACGKAKDGKGLRVTRW